MYTVVVKLLHNFWLVLVTLGKVSSLRLGADADKLIFNTLIYKTFCAAAAKAAGGCPPPLPPRAGGQPTRGSQGWFVVGGTLVALSEAEDGGSRACIHV